ncbi:hypothetical protein CHARACLAT_016505 [Characodon lateralis]|uniref:Uncharacterized protein n=1 Tax=Characodon lateralis TaxID=208331 RepID=A0ABU7CPJ5_9TELE|nr:hypothetical protein [Characodon lateralis]
MLLTCNTWLLLSIIFIQGALSFTPSFVPILGPSLFDNKRGICCVILYTFLCPDKTADLKDAAGFVGSFSGKVKPVLRSDFPSKNQANIEPTVYFPGFIEDAVI